MFEDIERRFKVDLNVLVIMVVDRYCLSFSTDRAVHCYKRALIFEISTSKGPLSIRLCCTTCSETPKLTLEAGRSATNLPLNTIIKVKIRSFCICLYRRTRG